MLTQHTTAAALLARFRAVRSATMEFCGPLIDTFAVKLQP